MSDGALQIVELRTGSSSRSLLELSYGAQLQPMSIGRSGAWSIDAPGILGVHAYFYFDGQGLFVQSADARNPARSNGRSIGATWQQVESPSTIELGGARLVFRTVEDLELDASDEDEDDDERTIAREALVTGIGPERSARHAPTPGPAPGPHTAPRPYVAPPSPQGLGEPEPTIVAPLHADEALHKAQLRPAAGLRAARPMSPASQDAPPSSHTTVGAPPVAPGARAYHEFGNVQVASDLASQAAHRPMSPTLQPWGADQDRPPAADRQAIPLPPETQMSLRAAGSSSLVGRMKKDWADTSLPKKVMFLLMPVLLAVLVAGQHRKEQAAADEAADAAQARRAAASASAAASANTAHDAVPVATVVPAPTAVVTAAPTASATQTSNKAGPVPKSLERVAADALAANDYATAAATYEQLAASLPGDPRRETYVIAARILHKKTARP